MVSKAGVCVRALTSQGFVDCKVEDTTNESNVILQKYKSKGHFTLWPRAVTMNL